MSKANKQTRLRLVSWLAMSACLTGCVVGPDYQAPDPDMPTAWSIAETQSNDERLEALADWWTLFDDPVLEDLIEQSIQGNPDRDYALARVREARAQFKITAADRFPTVSAGGAASATRSTDLAGESDWQGLYNANLDAGWEVDVFGGINRSIEAAKASLQAREADYIDVMTSLVAEVALAYVNVRTLQEQLRITRSSLAAQEETFDLTQWRAEAGLTSMLDVEQARANLESTRAQIPALERDLTQSQNTLSFLLGKAPGQLESIAQTPSAIPLAPAGATIGVPADILRQRSDIRSAERNLAAQSARIGIAITNLYPTFSLSGSLGSSAADVPGLFDDTALTTSLVSGVTAPIFNAGRLRANVEIEDAVYEQSLANYETTVLTALKDVEDNLTARAAALERTKTLTLAVESAERANRFATQQYESGLTGFDQVLDTQRTLLSLQEQLALNQSAETSAMISLYKAVGGGWDAAYMGQDE